MSRDNQSGSESPGRRPPHVLANRYEIRDVVGSGASAITWRGHDRRLERTVAIKILRRDVEEDDAFVRRFEREAQASAAVSSGNVVNVYDVGQEDGWLYLVMQYVDGEDLKHLIARMGSLPAREARDIARQILTGLAAIHRAGVLHRDIKPQNVLIDHDGVARVTDFGIAQSHLDSGLTTVGTTIGTAAYMAPEQAQAGDLTEATDIYAVGAVLYEMLTGELPFERPTAMATMLAHVQEPLVSPSQRAPSRDIPQDLNAIVMQAMAKHPHDRFATATAMQAALDGASIDSPWSAAGATRPLPSAQTRVAPAVNPRSQAWPGQPQQRVAPPARRVQPEAERGGTGFLTFLFVLILLAMAVLGGWLAWQWYDDNRVNEAATETPIVQSTEQEIVPTDPPPTEQVNIVPAEPTESPPTPTEEPIEPTQEPTNDQIIEPIGTPGS